MRHLLQAMLATERARASGRIDDETVLALVKATYGGFLAVTCHELALDVARVRRIDPHNPARGNALAHSPDAPARRAGLARAVAVYLTNTNANVPQFLLARVVGVTPVAVCQALHRIEDARDDNDQLERLIESVSRSVMGRAGI